MKLQYITPAIASKWNIKKVTMETQITDGKINLKGNFVFREKPKRADYVLFIPLLLLRQKTIITAFPTAYSRRWPMLKCLIFLLRLVSTVTDLPNMTFYPVRSDSLGVPLVTSKNLVDGNIDFETIKSFSVEDAQAINMRSAVDNGVILFAMIGTIGNPVLVKKDREFCIKNMALFKAIGQNLLDMEYLLLYLQNEQYVMK